MSQLSYGIERPEELFQKLTKDAEKLTAEPHPYDVFNFVVTAAVLNEWIFKFHKEHPTVVEIALAKDKRDSGLLPTQTLAWINDTECLPNRHCDIRRHIMNAMCICWDTANASKHYHWLGKSDVQAIGPEPVISSWYQYFFTSVEPDLYIDYGGECYGLSQIRRIILQFYGGLLTHIYAGEADARWPMPS